MRWFPAAIVLVASTACASVPVVRDVESLANYRGVSFTEAWDLVVGEFASRNWTIENLDRDSGTITSEWKSAENDSYRDCGSAGFRANFSNYQGRFNVAVRETDDGVAVTVDTSWQVTRNSANSIGIVGCLSTGVLERDVHRSLRRRGL
jgi:hypothetical protein